MAPASHPPTKERLIYNLSCSYRVTPTDEVETRVVVSLAAAGYERYGTYYIYQVGSNASNPPLSQRESDSERRAFVDRVIAPRFPELLARAARLANRALADLSVRGGIEISSDITIDVTLDTEVAGPDGSGTAVEATLIEAVGRIHNERANEWLLWNRASPPAWLIPPDDEHDLADLLAHPEELSPLQFEALAALFAQSVPRAAR